MPADTDNQSIGPLPSLLRAVIEALGESVVVFDKDGRVAFATESARPAVEGSGEQLLSDLIARGGRRVPLQLGQYLLGEAVFMRPPGEATLADRERRAILETVRVTGGRLAEAARHLGISRTTLWRRLKEYGIQPK